MGALKTLGPPFLETPTYVNARAGGSLSAIQIANQLQEKTSALPGGVSKDASTQL